MVDEGDIPHVDRQGGLVFLGFGNLNCWILELRVVWIWEWWVRSFGV